MKSLRAIESFGLGFALGLGAVFFIVATASTASSGSATINVIVPSICGNSKVESGEDCDDGNTSNSDGCSSVCKAEQGSPPVLPPPAPPNPVPAPACGNGKVEAGEQCDDANAVNGDGCSASCVSETPAPVCGNNKPETNEECDDGNKTNGDGCSASCTIELSPICGNSKLEINEQCDDGNTVSNDGCSSICKIEGKNQPKCGNAILEQGEACDDGNKLNNDGCSMSCHLEVPAGFCGNKVVESGEGCDDGNSTNSDGCSSNCQVESSPVSNPAGGGSAGGGNQDGASSASSSVSTTNPLVTFLTPIATSIGDSELVQEGLKVVDQTVTTAKEAVKTVEDQVRKVGITLTNQTKQLRKNIGVAAQKANELRHDPVVQNTTKQVVAPTTIVVSVAVATPSLASILFPLLRFLFLQPLVLLGARRREDWGEVYNSLNKLPVDLAVVRLVDAVTGRVLHSRVTDKGGRYLFSVDPGNYRLEVIKDGFSFPSQLLAGVTADGRKVDLYHGETIAATAENAQVTPTIPLDPAGVHKTPRRVLWERRLRSLQHSVSVTGIVATLVSLFISPVWYIWVFLVIHVLLYWVFLQFVRPRQPKGWGLVYDRTSRKPLGQAIARLFSKDYNKLIATEVTDKKGRYAFLVGPSSYYVKIEKTGYEENMKEMVIPEEQSIVKEDVGLERKKLST